MEGRSSPQMMRCPDSRGRRTPQPRGTLRAPIRYFQTGTFYHPCPPRCTLVVAGLQKVMQKSMLSVQAQAACTWGVLTAACRQSWTCGLGSVLAGREPIGVLVEVTKLCTSKDDRSSLIIVWSRVTSVLVSGDSTEISIDRCKCPGLSRATFSSRSTTLARGLPSSSHRLPRLSGGSCNTNHAARTQVRTRLSPGPSQLPLNTSPVPTRRHHGCREWRVGTCSSRPSPYPSMRLRTTLRGALLLLAALRASI